MYKPASRLASSAARALPRSATGRRFVSTAPPHKTSRSWKSSAARWGLAGAGVYYYNTASVFAEEPAYAIHAPPETPRETETYPTIESISEQRRAQSRTPTQEAAAPQSSSVAIAPDGATAAPGGPGELAEEAGQEGAFNEETGEINWDCPCLGGMATGPCGEQFKAAFSCFVFSKEEPKGVDCIEHFKTMQGCFREHPDIYGSELDDEQMEEAQTADENAPAGSYPTPSEPAPAAAPSLAAADNSPQGQSEKIAHVNSGPDSEHGTKAKRERAQAAAQQVEQDHGEKEVITESYEDAESYKHVPKA